MAKRSDYWAHVRRLDELWGDRIAAKCFYCGVKCFRHFEEPRGNADHVIPLARGGADSLSNLVIACRACNERKADKNLSLLFFLWEHRETGCQAGDNTGLFPVRCFTHNTVYSIGGHRKFS